MMQPKILYQDTDILAVNKPAGLLTHSDGLPAQAGKTKIKTLSDWLVKKFPKAKTVGELLAMSDGEETNRAGIVHRLDKDTSGVILLAKTQKGFECLKEQFMNHQVKKTYHAFVVGQPKESRGMIDRPIGKSVTDFRARSASLSAKGDVREAQTQYMVKKSNGQVSFIHAMPKTGRTHQIRVHMKLIGHPIVSDNLYGAKNILGKNNLGFKRTALHSFSVEFKNCQGDIIHVEAPYPSDFLTAVKKLNVKFQSSNVK